MSDKNVSFLQTPHLDAHLVLLKIGKMQLKSVFSIKNYKSR